MIQEIKGLQGFRGLPKKDREEFFKLNPELRGRRSQYVDRAYRNGLFVNKFGMERFNSMPNPADRDRLYENTVVNDAMVKTYGKDTGDFKGITSTAAKRFLLENGYQTNTQLERIANNNRKARETYSGAAFVPQTAQALTTVYSHGEEKAREKYNNHILEQAKKIDKDYLANREDVIQYEGALKNRMLQMVSEGNINYIEDVFNKTLDARDPVTHKPLFPYYAAYKDSPKIQDLSIYDKIDILSKNGAIRQAAMGAKTREEADNIYSKSMEMLNDDIQHRIYEKTGSLETLGKTEKMIVSKMYSSIGMTGLGLYYTYLNLTGDTDKANKFILGKDENGEELPWYYNMQYFSDVDSYNTISVPEINKARENGGVSKHALLRDVGEEYSLFTRESLAEGTGMLGYMAGSLAVDYALTGGGGAAIKATGKAATRRLIKMGVNPRNLVKARRVVDNPFTDLVGDVTRLNINAVSESGLEAANGAQETYLQVKQEQDTQEFKQKLKERVEQDVDKKLREEFPNYKGLDDVQKNKAIKERYIELVNEYTDYYEDAAEEEAINAAGATGHTLFASMQLKNTAMDAVFKTYMFAKPFRTKVRARQYFDPKKTIFKNGEFESKNFTWKDGALAVGKTVGGGALEEFTDNQVHNGSVELGLNYHNNFLQQLYNGDAIGKYSLMTGALMSYINGAEDAFFDPSAYLESFIGGLSPITGMSFRFSTIPKAFNKNYREAFKNLSKLEKFNEIVYSPLSISVLEAKNDYESNKQVVEQVNKVIKEHGEDFKTLTSSFDAVKAFNDIRDEGTVIDAKDSKFHLAFKFLSNLRTLAGAGKESKLFNDYMQMLEKAANGDISNEMVSEYLAQPGNKDLVIEQGTEMANAEARYQIKKNAESLLQMVNEFNDTYSTIKDFSKGTLDDESIQQLVFQTMISSNWESRMKDMENSLTGSPSIGTDRRVGQLTDEGKEMLVKEFEEKAKAVGDISKDGKPKGILKSIKKTYDNLANTYKNAVDNSLLTANEIIRLAPEERQRMLDNHGLYTSAQVAEIEKAENILAQKDPEYREKVRDVATLKQRIEQNNESYKLILDNPTQLQEYKANLAAQAIVDAVNNARKTYINNLINGFDSVESDNDAVITKAKQLNKVALKSLISARPQYTELLSPYVDRATTIENLNDTIEKLEVSENQKRVLRNSLATLVENTSTDKEVINAIENFIETTGDGKEETLILREQMNEILNAAKDFNIVRDAAKAYSNQSKLEKDRKIRAAKDRKNAKARAKTAEKRQARIAAEEARKAKEAEEERFRQEAEAKRKGEAMKGSKMEDTTKPGKVAVTFEEEFPDLGIEYDKNTSEVETPTEEPTEAPVETETPVEPDDELPPTDDNSEATQLRGNTLTPYSTKDLKESKLTSREETVTDWLKDFFNWMKNAGIKFQDIIDFELGEIAKLNPTVHYMMAVADKNATNDTVLSKTPLLVVEVTDAIKKIHDESRGGIIKANGKEWLVIGMMGYAPNSNEQTTWQNTLNVLSANRDAYFKSNPTERFEVDSRLTTSIKEISNGRLIKQLHKDSEYQYRSISELLADEERNPYGLTWKDLSFAIQMATGGFELSRTLEGTVYTPSRTEENAGNVFIMVKATNGNYFPVAIRPAFLSEIRPGALQDMIDSLLQDVLNPDHKIRLTAVSRLKFLLNLNDDNNILVGKDGLNVVSIKQNGVVVDKFNLDAENFDRAQAFKKLKASRFRIQISKNNLQDIERLKQLDEAGALTTDAAMLATAGAGYTIYATDLETGKPIDYEPISSSENTTVRGSGLYRSQEPTQMLDGKRVTFHNGQWVDDSGKAITDAETRNKIKALNYIEEHKIPVAYKSKNGYNVYIVSESKDNPVVVMVNGSHNVNIYKGTDAQRAIDFHNQQQRDKAAKNANMEEIELNLTDKPKEITTSTPPTPTVVSEKVTTSKEKTKKKETFSEVDEKKSVKDLQDSKNLLTFVNIITNKSFGKQVRKELKQIFKDKGWGEMPKKIPEIESFLNSKGVPMPSEMSQTQIDNWLDLIKKCIK